MTSWLRKALCSSDVTVGILARMEETASMECPIDIADFFIVSQLHMLLKIVV